MLLLQANLARLCGELEARALQLRVPFEPSSLALKLSTGLFLAHSTASSKFAKICGAQRISSMAELAAHEGTALRPDCAEAVLGTSDDVFFYVAPFRYKKSNCGFLFSQSLEVEHSVAGKATQFDSGGLVSFTPPPDPTESAQAFLAKNEMPIPDHRQYLAKVMMVLFSSPWEYVEGNSPCHPSPLELRGGDQREWTHEVRIPESVGVQGSVHLKAVFAPKGRLISDQRVRGLFSWCLQAGVDTVWFNKPDSSDGFDALQRECLEYIRQELY